MAMSRRKTERLLSLVVCLLSARRFLTANQIRAAVPGYPDSFDAFKRMFERDKDELRALGIPLETGTVGDDEAGYRISRQAYELPDIRLEPDEVAMLGLAARVWRRAELAGAADGAMLKLRAAGIDAEDLSQPRIEPRVQTAEPAFGPLWQAVRDRRPVSFGYKVPSRGSAQLRRLEPWGVVCRRGRWYVVGQDTERGAERVFRLSRIDGPVRFTGPAGSVTVPAGIDVRAAVHDWDGESSAPRTCLLRVRAAAGHGLRRYAERIEAERSTEDGEATGWDLVELGYSDIPWWSEHIASFGADVVVVEPSDLRDAVIGRLKGVLA
jgi:proteasome accessory factor B